MIKHSTILSFALLLMACSQTSAPLLNADNICQSPRPELCSMQYDPVCAEVAGKLKEYGNACSACGDVEVNSYQQGACPE
ncbi:MULTISPECIES: hypothetical protein [unclassified Agarivorans]|uniref:hypothetical protein n=1 Tax=unclassified Agarivorans TaxID=2636026 RepID=UPI003D7D7912